MQSTRGADIHKFLSPLPRKKRIRKNIKRILTKKFTPRELSTSAHLWWWWWGVSRYIYSLSGGVFMRYFQGQSLRVNLPLNCFSGALIPRGDHKGGGKSLLLSLKKLVFVVAARNLRRLVGVGITFPSTR